MAEASGILTSSRGQRQMYGALHRGSQAVQKHVIHKLRSSDTLTGLAVRYGVTVEDIKRANNLWTSDIFLRDQLKIPVKVEQEYSEADLLGPDTPQSSPRKEDDSQRSNSSKERSKSRSSQSPAEIQNTTEVTADDFFRKFDVKLLKIKGSLEKIESESSYSEEDMNTSKQEKEKRGRYLKNNRTERSETSSYSTTSNSHHKPSRLSGVAHTNRLADDTGNSISSDDQFFSL